MPSTSACLFGSSLFPHSACRLWRLTFDTPSVESEFCKAAFHRRRLLFQQSLMLVNTVFAAWLVYICAKGYAQGIPHWIAYSSLFAVVFALYFALLVASFTRRFFSPKFFLPYSIVVIVIASLAFVIPLATTVMFILTPVGIFSIYVMTVFLAYTLLSIPLAVAVFLSIILTVVTESLFDAIWSFTSPHYVAARILAYLGLHAIAIVVHLLYEVRLRTSFWYVTQSLLTRRTMEAERSLKQKMILSIVPQAFLEKILLKRKKRRFCQMAAEEASTRTKGHRAQPGAANLGEILLAEQSQKNAACELSANSGLGLEVFREFNVEKVDYVSIVFADICGFTKMSSKKHAAEVVFLLDDLFGRFDKICAVSGCYMISTFGGCCYCVSGCPTPRDDHAHCCVETGLGMHRAVRKFDDDNKEEVSVRVGIHTGSVLCGFIGLKRYKFDVWSNDVTMAKEMECSGQSGRVHISDDTYKLVKDDYETEEGPEIDDIRKPRESEEFYDPTKKRMVVGLRAVKKMVKTYFVIRRKKPCRYQKLTDEDEISEGAILSETPNQSKHRTDSGADQAVTPLLSVVSERGDLSTSQEALNESSVGVASKDCSKKSTDVVNISAVVPVPSANDLQLFDVVNEDMCKPNSFTRPPVHCATLRFTDSTLESNYGCHTGDPIPSDKANRKNLSNTGPSLFTNWILSLIFVVFVLAACAIAFPISTVFIAVSLTSFAVIAPLFLVVPVFSSMIGQGCGPFAPPSWFPRHIIFIILGSLFALLPTLIVLIDFSCPILSQESGTIYLILFIISLLHFSLFAHVPYFIRAGFGTGLTIAVAVLFCKYQCDVSTSLHVAYGAMRDTNSSTTLTFRDQIAVVDVPTDSPDSLIPIVAAAMNAVTTSPGVWMQTSPILIYSTTDLLYFEMIIALVSIVLLVWFVARESELAARLAWHSAIENRLTTFAARQELEVIDEVFAEVIPPHIPERFNQSPAFSQQHENCGVMFACIKNFSDLYEEGFNSGEGYLRALSELFGDFESLLDRPQFKDVEKIKTIGPCLMCASGLDNSRRSTNQDPNAHLYALMDYGFALIETLKNFNRSMPSFAFELYIAFNAGGIVSGVIGSTKLPYDIWGDTVNVASRMYSTGEDCHIQVSEDVANQLEDKYDFKRHGTVFVKGKGDMNTFFAVGKKL